MIIVTIFVIYNGIQWQVLRALLTPLGHGTSLLFNVLVLYYNLSFLYLLVISRLYSNICK